MHILAQLSNPEVQFVTYSRENLNVFGCLRTNINYNVNSASTDVYIVKTGTSILDMDLVTALQLHIKGGELISGLCNIPNQSFIHSA